MPRLYAHREIDIYRGIATGIGWYVSRANEGLSLPITQSVTLRVVKKFYPEGCTGCAIQAALNIGAATATKNCGNNRIILQIVRPGIGIAIVIGLDAVGIAVKLQIDPEAGVRENGISKDGVVDGGGVMHPESGKKGITHRSIAAVEGDDVARACVRAADGVIVAANLNAQCVA